MDAELKAEWISRLRSGRYKQGHGLLRRELIDVRTGARDIPHYCCLGVLAEVLIDKGEFAPWDKYGYTR